MIYVLIKCSFILLSDEKKIKQAAWNLTDLGLKKKRWIKPEISNKIAKKPKTFNIFYMLSNDFWLDIKNYHTDTFLIINIFYKLTHFN